MNESKLEKAITGLENLRDSIATDYIHDTYQAIGTINDALELLKEYKAIKESISDGIHETAKMFRRTAGDNEIPLKW